MEQDAQNCPRDKSIVAWLFALTSGAVRAVAPPPSLRAAVASSRLSTAQKPIDLESTAQGLLCEPAFDSRAFRVHPEVHTTVRCEAKVQPGGCKGKVQPLYIYYADDENDGQAY